VTTGEGVSTERQAFLAAIVASPDDDAARLVYADWLEEVGGEPERAEFIRVQVGASRGAKPASMRLWDLLHHSEGWFPDVGKALRIEWNKWGVMHDDTVHYECRHHTNEFFVRCGFVESVTCTAADWLAHADAIHWHPAQTVACGGDCKNHGGGGRVFDARRNSLPAGRPCPTCSGTGRVPRPCPATAQPITSVTLTTGLTPTQIFEYGGDPHDGTDWPPMRFLNRRYPGVTFTLPPLPSGTGGSATIAGVTVPVSAWSISSGQLMTDAFQGWSAQDFDQTFMSPDPPG
jgi:uncharacterized protein (TIGR02996 family)